MTLWVVPFTVSCLTWGGIVSSIILSVSIFAISQETSILSPLKHHQIMKSLSLNTHRSHDVKHNYFFFLLELQLLALVFYKHTTKMLHLI